MEKLRLTKRLKKASAILLAALLMIPPITPDTYVKAADAGDVTVLIDENFEGTSFNSNIQNRGSTIAVTELVAGNHELTVSGRTSDWNGIQIPVSVVSSSAITASMKVRSANSECVLGIQYNPNGGSTTEYKWIKNLATNLNSYVEISGTYTVPDGATDVRLFLQGNGTVNLEDIMVDDIEVTIPKTSAGPTTTFVEDFEGETHTGIARGAEIRVVSGAGISGSKALFVSGRTVNWQGVNFSADAYAGRTVTVSAQVKSLAPTMMISIQIGEGNAAVYRQVAQGSTGTDDYVLLSGTYNIPTGTTPIYLYVEGNDTSDFYVDDFTIIATAKTEKKIQENLLPLKTHMASTAAIGGKMGVAIPVTALEDNARMRLVTKHFNSVTCENEMKPESILGSTPTLDENGNPVFNFTAADKIMDYILAYNAAHPEDIIRARGHVLLWHSQTPSWFFKENYAADGAYVSKEVMLQRMDDYFKRVIQHYDGPDSKYKGLIYAWDVVNEQIDNGGIRVSDGGPGISNWYQVFQGDDIYIKEAFRLANLYAPPEVKLFYNDYGETDAWKVTAICKLLQNIKAYSGARLDGMGMQGHYNMVSPSPDVFETAVRAYAAIVNEIQITELDLQSSLDYTGENQSLEYTKQAYRYKGLFEKMAQLDQEEGIDITSVTMWGTHDGASWLNSSSVVGGGADGRRKQCPLLFDDEYQAKPAYYAIVDPSQLEPFTNSIKALYSEESNWAIAPATSYTLNGTEISFKTLWKDDGLNVQVLVKDNTPEADDKIVVYVDEANSKSATSEIKQYILPRSNSTATAEGYMGTFNIPLSSYQVGKVIGFDIAVFNNGMKLSWNDLKDTQESTSKYYGELTLKPYAQCNYGTPVIDGVLDAIWQTQNSLPLTVKTNNPQATASVRILWDDTNFYVFADVTDSNLSKASTNPWEEDSLEIFLDQNNAKTSAYEEDDCQYRINFDNEASFNGTKCTAENLLSAAKLTDHGYVIEAAIKWTDVTPVNGTVVGVDFQINDDAGTGSRAGTYNWYDSTGTGYNNPSVFGTITLIKKSSDNTGGNTGGNAGGNNGGGTPGGDSTVPDNTYNTGDTNDDNKVTEVAEKTLQEAAAESNVITKLLKNSKVKGTALFVTKTNEGAEIVKTKVEGAKPGSKVYIYRVNEVTGKLETVAYGFSYTVDEEGNVSFPVMEGGNYIVLTKKAASKLVTPLRNQIKVTAPKSIKAGENASIKLELPSTLELVNSLGSETTFDGVGATVVSYKVSEPSVATVDKDGKIIAKKKGKVTITITVKLYNNTYKTYKTKITIK